MTSRTTEIQSLIADIDGLLANTGKRLSRSLFQKASSSVDDTNSQPRQILERVRSLLIDLSSENGDGNREVAGVLPTNSPILAKLRGEDLPSPQEQINEVITPLREEIRALLAERQNLVQEIRELEQQRLKNHSLAQQLAQQEQTIAEFLQVLTNRLDARFPLPPSSTGSGNWDNTVIPPSPEFNLPDIPHAAVGAIGNHPSTEKLARLTEELDRRLLALDGTVNVVFDALQRNIQTYGESLSQSLTRMQSTSQQGEEVLINLIRNLTQAIPTQVNPGNTSSGSSSNSSSNSPTRIISADPLVNFPQSNPQQQSGEESTSISSPSTSIDTPDLDALLLELSQDMDTSSNIANQPRTSKNIPGNDAIDALYAGLFTTDVKPNYNGNFYTPPQPETISQPNQDQNAVQDTVTDRGNSDIINGIDEIATILADPGNGEIYLQTVEHTSPEVETTTPAIHPVNPSEIIVTESSQTELVVEETTIENPPETSSEISQSAQDLYPPTTLDPNLVVKILPSNPNSPTSPPQELTDPWLDDPEESNPSETIAAQPPEPSDIITTLTDLEIKPQPPTPELTTNSPSHQTPLSSAISRDVSRDNLIAQATASLDLDQIIPEISLDSQQQAQLHADLTQFEAQPAIPLPLETPEIASTPTLPTPNLETARMGDTQITPLPEPEIISITQSSDDDDAQNAAADSAETVWYLGIDIGTTGISAALLNRTTTEIYPIYWSTGVETNSTTPLREEIDLANTKRTFRLPAEVYLQTNHTSDNSHQFTAQLKPYLQIALPYRNEQNSWEPNLQLNEAASVSLAWIVRSLSKLFLTLKADTHSTTIGLTASALGLPVANFTQIIENLSGVICNCPTNWSEQYRFNIREALLIAKLVSHPQEVFFVEEAIASLICELDGANGEEVYTHTANQLQPTRSQEAPILGNTLAINLGASGTEMSLVDIPENLLELAHSDFMLHSFAYGGKGIEQDIICQLLLPEKWRQSRLVKNTDDTITSTPWHWLPTIPGLEQTRLSSLKWSEISLPHPGEPDLPERIHLQKRLETYPLGQALLDVANAIKLILQHQETFTFELADQRWLLHRRDLESQVFVPFVRRLNRELNRLLVARGIPTEAIDQVILSGGVANLTAVNRWLRQKLPNAQIIQHPHTSENNSPNCSRVAYGLSVLPLHPQILDIPRQQYTDYFLFTELLNLIPTSPEHTPQARPITFGEIISRLEAKGINTRTCQQRILAFLEGELPSGVVPNSIDSLWLTPSSLDSHEYRAITANPLFCKQGSLSYQPNYQQIQILRHYLDTIQSSNQQSLAEPYTVNFALGIPIS